MKLHLKPICFFSFAMGFALVAHAHATFPVRVDCRGTDLPSCGTERLGTPVGGAVEEWDTTVLEDGRLSLSSGQSVAEVLIANGAQVEGGRLAANVEWGTEKPHVVRHDVVVPPGCTLTLRNGATVLFSEGARIWIEAGGRIVAEGAIMASLASNLTEDGKIVANGGIRSGGHDGWWWNDPHSASLATWRKPVADCLSLKDAGLVEIGFENGMELGLVPRVYTAGTADVCYGELPVPEREGFVFEGWQAMVAGTEIPIGEGVPVFAEATNLVAKWTALPVHSVSFDANGGTGDMASLSVMQGKAVELPANRFGWDGCEFMGWSTNGTDEVAYEDGETIVVASDMNLHAVWSGDLDLRFYWPGEWLDRAFISLSSDPDYPVYHVSCEEEVDLRFAVANDGSFPLAEVPVSVAFVDTNNEVLASAVLTNTFAGGFLNPGKYFDPDLWLGTLDGLEPANYTMRLSVDMGDWMGGDVHPADNTVYLRFAIADTNITLPDALDRPDWSFVCTEGRESPMCEGFMTADGKDAVQFGPLPPNATNSLSTTVTGPGTLSFRWRTSCEPKFDNFRFVVDGEWVASMSGIFADWETMSHFLEEGPHEIEWRYTKDESVSIGLDCAWLDAVEWEPSEIVTVSFASAGEEDLGDLLCYSGIGYGNLPEPTRTGYRFDGWWTAAVGGMQVTSTSIVTEASARTLYAHWMPRTQTVTFLSTSYTGLPGGDVLDTQEYTMGQPYGYLPTPQEFPALANKFLGWVREEWASETLVATNDIVGTDDTLTLYTLWTHLPDYVIRSAYLAPSPDAADSATRFSPSDSVYLQLEFGDEEAWFFEPPSGCVEVDVRDSSGRRVGAWIWNVEDDNWDIENPVAWKTNVNLKTFSDISAAGTYSVTVTVDAKDDVEELVETNNTCMLPFEVKESVSPPEKTFRVTGCTMDAEAGVCTLLFVGDAGKLYLVQRTASLEAPWNTVQKFQATSSGEQSLETIMPGKWWGGFYRLIVSE